MHCTRLLIMDTSIWIKNVETFAISSKVSDAFINHSAQVDLLPLFWIKTRAPCRPWHMLHFVSDDQVLLWHDEYWVTR